MDKPESIDYFMAAMLTVITVVVGGFVIVGWFSALFTAPMVTLICTGLFVVAFKWVFPKVLKGLLNM